METLTNFELIVTIVTKGKTEKILEASRKAGAEGGTIVYGRGIGIHEQKKFLGLLIEPEKELILTLVPKEKTEGILQAIVDAGGLNKPGTGIGFVLDVSKVVGINHFIRDLQDGQL